MVCSRCGHTSSSFQASICDLCKTPLISQAGVYGWLVSPNRQIAITDSGLTVGRAAGNTFLIEDAEVSRAHAKLNVLPGPEVRLTDTSSNGTFVDGKRIQETALHPNAKIRFGLSDANTYSFEAGPAFASNKKAAAAAAAPAPAKPKGTVMLPTVEPVKKSQTVLMSESALLDAIKQSETQAKAAGAPKCRLQIVLDRYAVEDVPLNPGTLTLGRHEGPYHLKIDHPSVSDEHAELTIAPDGTAKLKDLGSTNGTFVNGRRTMEAQLQEGDLIQLGACDTTLLLFRASKPRVQRLMDIDLSAQLVKLGRSKDNDIVLDHPTVSSHHAEIRRTGTGHMIVDLGSTNGTFVNGTKITTQQLKPKDRVSLGALQFVFDGKGMEQPKSGSSQMRLCALSLTKEAQDFKTGKTIRLLDNVSLVLDPCEFVGLLGPSGSGKSTLMDALNGFRPASSGRVLLNDRELYRYLENLRALIGYLPQDDILHKELSVRECLYYSAKLRLPDDFREGELAARVREVIDNLELNERADNMVFQLSGGQRKRVSLGIELLNKPGLLFVDEPTAGQDPRTEMKMMQLFRGIANRGSTVMINTHLLGSFSLLDKVAVLVRGKLAYFGPSQQMLPYFHCKRPEEVFDKLQEHDAEHWSKQYRDSDLHNEFVAHPLQEEQAASLKQKDSKPAKPPKRSVFRQLMTLFSRQMALKTKDKASLFWIVFPPIVIALMMGWMKGGANEPKSLFMTIVVALWFGCSACVREIVDELPIFKRERQRDLKISAYLGSKLLYLFGVAAVQSSLFVGIMTFLGAQDGHFGGALAITWMMAVEGGLIGLLISASVNTAESALLLFPLALIPQLLFAGLLIPVNPLHPFYPRFDTKLGTVTVEDVPAEMVPAPMGPVLRYGLSPVMVARWGFEALSDLYIHDYTDAMMRKERYPQVLMNSTAITFHPNDVAKVRNRLDELSRKRTPLTPADANFEMGDPALPQYLGILGGFAVLASLLTAGALRLKERGNAG